MTYFTCLPAPPCKRETKFERNVELTFHRLWHALKQSFKQLCEIKPGHDVGRIAKYPTMNNDLLSIQEVG